MPMRPLAQPIPLIQYAATVRVCRLRLNDF
jgi:hypothetical protein